MDDTHKDDHDRIIKKLDENSSIWQKLNELSGLEKDHILLNERIAEMKADKEKASAWSMRLVGIAASLIMLLAGGAITQYATINTLQEKVTQLEINNKEHSTNISDNKDGFAKVQDWVDYGFLTKENFESFKQDVRDLEVKVDEHLSNH